MGFDQINKLDSQTDTDSSTPSTGSGTGVSGTGVDFGNLTQGETVIDKTDKKMSALLKRSKELAAIFKRVQNRVWRFPKKNKYHYCRN